MKAETLIFGNKLKVSSSNIQLGRSSIAASSIKEVGIRPAAPWWSFAWRGGLAVLLWSILLEESRKSSWGNAIETHLYVSVLLLAALAGVFFLLLRTNERHVYIKRGLFPKVIFKTRNFNEAVRLRRAIEEII